MQFIITVYRRQRQGMARPPVYSPMPVMHFNADNLPEARQKMLKAQAVRYVHKVELSVILDTWYVKEEGV
jgi:hypothetical protein